MARIIRKLLSYVEAPPRPYVTAIFWIPAPPDRAFAV